MLAYVYGIKPALEARKKDEEEWIELDDIEHFVKVNRVPLCTSTSASEAVVDNIEHFVKVNRVP